MFKTFINYCKESIEELRHKVTWPTWRSLGHSSIVVLGASIVIALIVFAMDKVFQLLMTTIYPH